MAPVIRAEVTLVSLKSCLVNLPPNIIALLSNSNTAPQNVVVELQYRSSISPSGAVSSTGFQRSAYVGWTGMPSRARNTSLLNERARSGRDQEVQSVEIDATFAKLVGLSDGQRVGLLVHLDPVVVRTVNIEPLTPADWEAIELHATFLELNLLSQIRALPNPTFKDPSQSQSDHGHALTLHLSPTSTANIVVTSLSPSLPTSAAFAKIAPDAEVIVAPKTRTKSTKSGRGDTRSITSRQSGKTRTGARAPASKKVVERKQSVFLRGVDWSIGQDFLSDQNQQNEGLKVWLPNDVVSSDALRGASFVSVKIVKPAGLRAQLDQTQMQHLKEEDSSEVGRPAAKVVARVVVWNRPLDNNHALLSTALCEMFDLPNLSGLVIQVESASSPIPRNGLKNFTFFPFVSSSGLKKEGLKFGGDSKVQRQAQIDRLKITHGGDDGLLSGPLTDGMVLPPGGNPSSSASFDGGILRFERPSEFDPEHDSLLWALGGEQRQEFDVRGEIPHPLPTSTLFPTFVSGLPNSLPELIGIDKALKDCTANLTLCSSVLLTGAIGSGKTTVAQHLGTRLREDYLFNVTYFSCQSLTTDETRVSTIKEKLTQLFMSASWGTRLGGQSLVILDDLDKICPVETELQVGNDNGRSRQVTELFISIVRQYCSIQSGVTLLATAQSKDNLNNIIIGGHIVSEIIALKAPTKEVRRDILVKLVSLGHSPQTSSAHHRSISRGSNDSSANHSVSNSPWLNPSNPSSRPGSSSSFPPEPQSSEDGFVPSPSLDLLEVAGKTDGYMPADLSLLVSRAQNECLIRNVTSLATDQPEQDSPQLVLTKADFVSALRGFTPSSLRNVSLTHSTTSFTSIGGLHETRNTLLETLLYPTKYAPIFSKSPLRLRSGLLLYGYPGCGKTLLASAIASEANLNFISVKGPEILNKYIGASEKSVRDLFERAQAARPCVLFFDEFDSIAPKRGHDSTGVTDRVVNQMLTQMDGAEGLEGVYVLAATSRPDLIDPALLRPGRLDKSLLCDMPNQADRADILHAVSRKLHLAADVASRVPEIASRTEGFSGADLQALMYNAHLEAIHDLLGDHKSSKSAATTTPSSAPPSAPSSPRATKSKSFHQATTTHTHTAGATNGISSASSRPSTQGSNSPARPGSRGSTGSGSSVSNHNTSNKKDKSSFSSPSLSSPSSSADFIQFLYDATEDAAAKAAPTTAALDPRAVIAAKLDELKLARKRERAALRSRHHHGGDVPTSSMSAKAGTDGNGGNDDSAAVVVMIEWSHVEKSLKGTRSSISPQERRRLQGIYREFVVGRNGEMPSGDGGREVGGRSTLM